LKSLHAAAGVCAIAVWTDFGLLPVVNAAESRTTESNSVLIRLVLANLRAHGVALQVDDSAVMLAAEGQLVACGEVHHGGASRMSRTGGRSCLSLGYGRIRTATWPPSTDRDRRSASSRPAVCAGSRVRCVGLVVPESDRHFRHRTWIDRPSRCLANCRQTGEFIGGPAEKLDLRQWQRPKCLRAP
jgi:hypothetical protein